MKLTIIATLAAALLIVGALLLAGGGGAAPEGLGNLEQNVSVVGGQQIVRLGAKGGYWPKTSEAAANLPTTIEVTTSGSFDCSTALVIPSLKYRQNLPPSGTTKIEVPPQAAGTKLEGRCSMGMYNFAINFN